MQEVTVREREQVITALEGVGRRAATAITARYEDVDGRRVAQEIRRMDGIDLTEMAYEIKTGRVKLFRE